MADEESPMLTDAPTERLPVFVDVLERWFPPADEDDDVIVAPALPTGCFSGTLLEQADQAAARPKFPRLSEKDRAELEASRPSYEVLVAVRDGLQGLLNSELPPSES